MINYLAYFIIVPKGKGSKVSSLAFQYGINNSTIFTAKGTIKDGFLNMLGILSDLKEIVCMISDDSIGNLAIEKIIEKFKLHKLNNGIVFSMPIIEAIGVEGVDVSLNKEDIMAQQIIFTIVNRGLSNKVIECANKAGATGGTILNGRGSGIENAPKLFNVEIEPEKEIIMIIVDKEIKDNVVQAIKNEMQIDQPNKGIVFVVDLHQTFGLYRKE